MERETRDYEPQEYGWEYGEMPYPSEAYDDWDRFGSEQMIARFEGDTYEGRRLRDNDVAIGAQNALSSLADVAPSLLVGTYAYSRGRTAQQKMLNSAVFGLGTRAIQSAVRSVVSTMYEYGKRQANALLFDRGKPKEKIPSYMIQQVENGKLSMLQAYREYFNDPSNSYRLSDRDQRWFQRMRQKVNSARYNREIRNSMIVTSGGWKPGYGYDYRRKKRKRRKRFYKRKYYFY